MLAQRCLSSLMLPVRAEAGLVGASRIAVQRAFRLEADVGSRKRLISL